MSSEEAGWIDINLNVDSNESKEDRLQRVENEFEDQWSQTTNPSVDQSSLLALVQSAAKVTGAGYNPLTRGQMMGRNASAISKHNIMFMCPNPCCSSHERFMHAGFKASEVNLTILEAVGEATHGETLCPICVGVDMSDSSAEEALKETKGYTSAAVNNGKLFVCKFDEEGRKLSLQQPKGEHGKNGRQGKRNIPVYKSVEELFALKNGDALKGTKGYIRAAVNNGKLFVCKFDVEGRMLSVLVQLPSEDFVQKTPKQLSGKKRKSGQQNEGGDSVGTADFSEETELLDNLRSECGAFEQDEWGLPFACRSPLTETELLDNLRSECGAFEQDEWGLPFAPRSPLTGASPLVPLVGEESASVGTADFTEESDYGVMNYSLEPTECEPPPPCHSPLRPPGDGCFDFPENY